MPPYAGSSRVRPSHKGPFWARKSLGIKRTYDPERGVMSPALLEEFFCISQQPGAQGNCWGSRCLCYSKYPLWPNFRGFGSCFLSIYSFILLSWTTHAFTVVHIISVGTASVYIWKLTWDPFLFSPVCFDDSQIAEASFPMFILV